MALVKCKVCGEGVYSEAALCPHCGVPEPGITGPSEVTVHREPRLSGIAGAIYIYWNGELKVKLMNDESITFEVSPGAHILKATAFIEIFAKEVRIKFIEGHKYHIDVYVSMSGYTVETYDITKPSDK